MNNNERWESMYLQIVGYLYTYKRRPSKYYNEDLRMVNWMKYNRKLELRGELSPERLKKFNVLTALCEKYQRINQNAYVNPDVVPADKL
ncbi:MAG: hypothetical protein J6I61_12535 [Prevotella sp.]|nr:hypothetical protein [Prevotella sp.]